MTQPAFDPTMLGGLPSTPPIPMVVCWADLEPTAYTGRLTELADWITWLRATYRIPATALPPCWFAHPGIREDIGHLWTGWLLTRHPDAGVGMIGLDWDSRREAAINRLREATAVTGCTATRHQPEPEPANPATSAIDQLWQEHLDTQTNQRFRGIAHRAAREIVIEILQAAELRHDLAPAILAEITDNPAGAGDDQKQAVAERLRQVAVDALDRVTRSVVEAAATVLDAQQHAVLEAAVADARDDIASSLASSALNRHASGVDLDHDLSQDWLRALEHLLPATIAADRAAAAATARSAAVDQRAAARRRHPNIDDLLP